MAYLIHKPLPRILLFIVPVVLCGPTLVSAQGETGPQGFCDGDPEHYEHNIPLPDMTECQESHNLHFPGWENENDCRDTNQVATCRGCFGCCNGKFDEKTGCHCAPVWGPARQVCYRTADRVRSDCQAQCGVPFNDCDPENDRNFRFPNA